VGQDKTRNRNINANLAPEGATQNRGGIKGVMLGAASPKKDEDNYRKPAKNICLEENRGESRDEIHQKKVKRSTERDEIAD